MPERIWKKGGKRKERKRERAQRRDDGLSLYTYILLYITRTHLDKVQSFCGLLHIHVHFTNPPTYYPPASAINPPNLLAPLAAHHWTISLAHPPTIGPLQTVALEGFVLGMYTLSL